MSSFRIEEHLLTGLHAIKVRDGVPISEQVRRALEMWLESKGITTKPARPRREARKRP